MRNLIKFENQFGIDKLLKVKVLSFGISFFGQNF